MGKQIRFFASNKDFEYVLQFAENSNMQKLPLEVNTQDYDSVGYVETSEPTENHKGNSLTPIYLLPNGASILDVFYHEHPRKPELSYLADGVSPVIELSQSLGKISPNRIVEGRVFTAAPKTTEQNDKAVKNGFSLLRREIKKWTLVENANGYVGPDAAELVKKGEAKLFLAINKEVDYPVSTECK